MRVWFDTEFIDNGWALDANTHLISIGLVREDGEALYIENQGASRIYLKQDPWLSKHVLPKLGPMEKRLLITEMQDPIKEFCGSQPQFWAHYAAYDWILLCKIFGGLLSLPSRWPHFCRDTRVLQELCGDYKEPFKDPGRAHDALFDAIWCKELWEELTTRNEERIPKAWGGAL